MTARGPVSDRHMSRLPGVRDCANLRIVAHGISQGYMWTIRGKWRNLSPRCQQCPARYSRRAQLLATEAELARLKAEQPPRPSGGLILPEPRIITRRFMETIGSSRRGSARIASGLGQR
jgi:hypothetical protein